MKFWKSKNMCEFRVMAENDFEGICKLIFNLDSAVDHSTMNSWSGKITP